MNKTQTTTAMLALALSALLAHGATAQTGTSTSGTSATGSTPASPTQPTTTPTNQNNPTPTSSTDSKATAGAAGTAGSSGTMGTYGTTTPSTRNSTNPTSSNPTSSTTTSTGTAMNTTTSSGLNVSGRVVSKSGDTVVIETDNGNRMTFATNTSTVTPTTWAVGDRVTVGYATPTSGSYLANNIALLDATGTGNAGGSTDGSYAANAPATAGGAYDTRSTTAATDTTGRETSATTLPRTASQVPLSLLIGAGAAFAAAALHLTRRSG